MTHDFSRSFRDANHSLENACAVTTSTCRVFDVLKQTAPTTFSTKRFDGTTIRREMRGSGVKSGKGPEGRVMYL